jgi:hypothetical protein
VNFTLPTTDENLPIPDLKQLLSPDANYGLSATGLPIDLLVNSRLGLLMPNALQSSAKLFRLITPYSMDLDRMGGAPGQRFEYNPLTGVDITGGLGYQLDITKPPNQRFPQGGPTTFDAIAQTWNGNPNPGGDIRSPASYNGQQFADGRSHLADQGRVDLNRPLTPWPTTQQTGAAYGANEMAQANQALADRVLLAKDIFDRFTTATFGYLPAVPNPITGKYDDPLPPLSMVTGWTDINGNHPPVWAPGTPQFEAMRFLAQLAVNIVDFIDDDDFITPFNWSDSIAQATQQPFTNPNLAQSTWVFGTEMPRLVINEAYAQVQNDPTDPFPPGASAAYQQPGGTIGDPDTTPTDPATLPFPAGTTAGRKASKNFRVNFVVELYNPYQNDPSLPDKGAARLQLTGPATPVYQIVMMSSADTGNTGQGLRAPGNVDGTPQPKAGAPPATQRINLTMQNWDPDPAMNPAPPPVAPPDKYTYLVQPAGNNTSTTSGSNQGFFVVGPSPAVTNQDWQAQFPHKRGAGTQVPFGPTLGVTDNSMSASLDYQNTNIPRQGAGQPHDLSSFTTTVLLRRLATPYLPATNNPQQPNYNPYVTVDYLDGIKINDAILYDNTGPCDGTGTNPQRQSLDQRFSYGRRQPFRGNVVTQSSPIGTQSVAQNTFFFQNGNVTYTGPTMTGATFAPGGNLDTPFQWFAHLDRQVSSPMELLHVSAYKPHELTQQFINTTAVPLNANDPAIFKHMAPWFDYDPQQPGVTLSTRLYRCLEMLGGRDRTEGAAFAARIQGRVNLNAFWDWEIMQAVADAKPAGDPTAGNFFDQSTVNGVLTGTSLTTGFWNQRSPYIDPTTGARAPSTTLPTPTTGDRVFWPLAVPNPGPVAMNPNGDAQFLPAGRGLNRTILRDNDYTQPSLPLLNVAANPPQVPQHPYIQNEMLQKTYGHYTTRGNVFAVFVTTGFFLVRADPAVDFTGADQYRPPLLGTEVDTTLRHQFFAIVDRTNLTIDQDPAKGGRIQGNRPVFFPFAPIDPNNNFNPLTVTNVADAAKVPVTITVPSYGVGPNGGILVRDTIDHYGRDFDQAGTNSTGEVFEILPGINQQLFIDVGSRAEACTVLNIVNAAAGQITVLTNFRHHAGCAVCTQQLGNPGPQPLPIDYESPPYSGVVPFRVILK